MTTILEQSTMTREEQTTMAKQLRSEGKKYDDIAAILGKKGALTKQGKPSHGYVHSLVNGPAIAQKVRRTRGKGKKYAAPVGTTSKWDVLRCIETCADFKPQVQKSLVGLILQELYK